MALTLKYVMMKTKNFVSIKKVINTVLEKVTRKMFNSVIKQ